MGYVSRPQGSQSDVCSTNESANLLLRFHHMVPGFQNPPITRLTKSGASVKCMHFLCNASGKLAWESSAIWGFADASFEAGDSGEAWKLRWSFAANLWKREPSLFALEFFLFF